MYIESPTLHCWCTCNRNQSSAPMAPGPLAQGLHEQQCVRAIRKHGRSASMKLWRHCVRPGCGTSGPAPRSYSYMVSQCLYP